MSYNPELALKKGTGHSPCRLVCLCFGEADCGEHVLIDSGSMLLAETKERIRRRYGMSISPRVVLRKPDFTLSSSPQDGERVIVEWDDEEYRQNEDQGSLSVRMGNLERAFRDLAATLESMSDGR